MSDLQFCVNLWLSAAKMKFDRRSTTVWHKPHITSDDTTISLEWWKGTRGLLVNFKEIDDNFRVSCLRVWGVNIHTQMSEKVIDSLDDFEPEWAWLLTE